MPTNLRQIDGRMPVVIPRACSASGSGSFPLKKRGNTDSKIKGDVQTSPNLTNSLPILCTFGFGHVHELTLNSVWSARWAMKSVYMAVFRPLLGRGR